MAALVAPRLPASLRLKTGLVTPKAQRRLLQSVKRGPIWKKSLDVNGLQQPGMSSGCVLASNLGAAVLFYLFVCFLFSKSRPSTTLTIRF